MKKVILAIRDQKINGFMDPVFGPTIGAMIRGLQDAVNVEVTSQSPDIVKHPEDFEVFQLGSWDDTTGQFVILESPESVCLVKSLVRSQN